MTIAFLKSFVLTLIPFTVIDLFWLGLVAPSFYKKHIGFIMAKQVNWPAAILFYLIFIAGLVYFVTFQETSLQQAAIKGAVFGFVCYATYDLTNMATLEGWPLTVTVVDMLWGTILCSLTAVGSVYLQRFI